MATTQPPTPPEERDADPLETREWIEALDALIAAEGKERATFLLRRLLQHARVRRVPLPQVLDTPYVQHHRPRRAAAATRATSRSRRASRRWCAGTRSRWWCAPTARAPSWAATSRATPRPPTSSRWASTISSAPGTSGDIVYFQPHSAPGVYARAYPRGAALRGAARPLPPRDGRRGPVLVPAPVAHAELLAVPDRLHGPGAALRDLPGALHALPRAPRPSSPPPGARCGRSWATARWTSPSRSRACRSPRASASTTSSSWSTATCSASTARCAATARSSRSWRACSPARAGT